MNTKKSAVRRLVRQPGAWCAVGAVALAASKLTAVQPVIYGGPLVPVSPELLRDERQANLTNSPDVFIPATEAARSDLPEIFRAGPWSFRPHFDYQFLYGDGIQSTPAVRGATAIHTLTPGFTVEYGRHWALGYSPSFTLYSNNHFHDTVGHSVFLSGATAYNDWQFGLSQTFASSEQVLSETGGQTEQESFVTTVSATRALNDRLSADFGFTQSIADTQGFQGSRDWSLNAALNYQFWSRLSVGVGTALGYVDVDIGPAQVYQQLSAHAKWRITDKMGVSVNAGGEAREFDGADTLFSPTYGMSFQYQPRERTQLSLGVTRNIVPSLFAGQVTETTGLNVNLYQQLFKQFRLSVGAGYNLEEFTLSNGRNNRRDEITTYNATLSHPLFKRGTLSLIYQYSDNRSSDGQYTYRTDQFGASFNYSF
jgi:hypothetical protein